MLESLVKEDSPLAAILNARIDRLTEPLRDRAYLVPMRSRESERNLKSRLRSW